MKKKTLCGLMSGSSLDGLDLSVVEFNTDQTNSIDWNIIHMDVFDFPKHLKSALKNSAELPVKALLAVETEFSEWCGKKIKNLPQHVYKKLMPLQFMVIQQHTNRH